MADDDVELDIGLKLDDQLFTASYDKLINSLADKTQKAIQHTLDHIKGPVSKNWGQFPFADMHSSSGGRIAERAFLASLAADLQKQGFEKSSNEFKAALLNAQYMTSFPDPVQRYRRMQAEGYGKAAELTAPGTALGKIIQQDWEFLRSPWSRDYIVSEKHEGFKREELEKLHVSQLKDLAREQGLKVKSRVHKDDLIDALVQRSNESDTHIDFGGMRKMYNMLLEKQMLFAGKVSVEDLEAKVAAGEGKWKLPYGPHREDNFELINKELDSINEKSSKVTKHYRDWGDGLKTVLGTLAGIAGLAVKTGAAIVGAVAVGYKLSERTVTATAASMDKRRAFLGMTSADVAATQVAGASVSLGADSVFNEIEKLSAQKEEYLTFGKGLDPLYSSLQGTFSILAGTDNPYLAYKKMADKLYKDLKNAPEDVRQKSLMLLDKQGLGSLSHIVGAFLSNPELAKEFGDSPSKLFRVLSNEYREGAVGTSELQTARLAALNESLKKSYGQMATDFEDAFGLPFKTWWEETMEQKVVPAFQKIASAIKPFTDILFRSEEQKKKDEEEGVVAFGTWKIYDALEEQIGARNKVINENQTWRPGWQYKKPKGALPGFVKDSDWEKWLIPSKENAGKGAKAYWDLFEQIANDTTKMEGPAAGVRERVQKMRDIMRDSGLYKLLSNNKADVADVPLMQAMQLGAYSDKGFEQFNSLINAMLESASSSIDLSNVEEILKNIEKNTGKADQVLENEYLKAYIISMGGLPLYQSIQGAVEAHKNNAANRSH